MRRSEGSSFEEGKRSAMRGWFRVPKIPPVPRGVSLSAEEAEKDALVKEVLKYMCLYTKNYGHDCFALTDSELLEMWGEESGKPGDAARARARFAKVLTFLQAERTYPDPWTAYKYGRNEVELFMRRGFIHVERWENKDSDIGIWVLLCLKSGFRVPASYVREAVLQSIEELENPTEPLDEDFWED